MKRLVHFIMRLLGFTPVVLKDFEGRIYFSYAKKADPWSELTAPRSYWLRVGHFVLLPDGTIKQPSYMKLWKEQP